MSAREPNVHNLSLTSCVLAADDLLEQVFVWLCQRRKDYPPHADGWRFRRQSTTTCRSTGWRVTSRTVRC